MKCYLPEHNIVSEIIIDEDDPSQCGVRYTGDIQPLLDANKAAQNSEVGSFHRHVRKDYPLGYKVASFDANAIAHFRCVHKLNFFNPVDRDQILRMIDTDPDYRFLKSTTDRIM